VALWRFRHGADPVGMAPTPQVGAGSPHLYTDDQLHARACIVCSRTDGVLLRDGYVSIEVRPDEPLAWVVVACPEHQGSPS